VGGAVLRTAVGFDLDQPAPAQPAVSLADQQLADEVAGDLQRVAGEEAGAEHLPGRP